MSKIPKQILAQILNDPWYEFCCHQGCGKQAELEHALYYCGRKIQEKFSIIPCCPGHNRGNELNKRYNEYVALSRATEEELNRYAKANFRQLREHLTKRYGM